MARWVGAQGQVNLAKTAKTCPLYDVNHRKPKTNNFVFNLKQKTCQIRRGFEQLSSSLC